MDRNCIFFTSVVVAVALNSCDAIFLHEKDPTPTEVFDEFWEAVDRRYVCFSNKDVDWDGVYSKYRPQISDRTDEEELFSVLSRMFGEFKDGHTALSSGTKKWSGYQIDSEINYSQGVVNQYFNSIIRRSGPLQYSIIGEGVVGYIRYASLSDNITDKQVVEVLDYCRNCQGLILDLRENPGGELQNVFTLLKYLPTKNEIYRTYSRHNAVREDLQLSEIIMLNEMVSESKKWYQPFIVLIDSRSYSASSIFAMCAKECMNVKTVGVKSGGGTSFADYFELSNGWIYRIPTKKVIPGSGIDYENGIIPDYEIHLDPVAVAENRDNIIDFACEVIHSLLNK